MRQSNAMSARAWMRHSKDAGRARQRTAQAH